LKDLKNKVLERHFGHKGAIRREWITVGVHKEESTALCLSLNASIVTK